MLGHAKRALCVSRFSVYRLSVGARCGRNRRDHSFTKSPEHAANVRCLNGQGLPLFIREDCIVSRELKVILQLSCGLDADVEESREFPLRICPATLDDIERNGFSGARHLRFQRRIAGSWESVRGPPDVERERMRIRPYSESTIVLHDSKTGLTRWVCGTQRFRDWPKEPPSGRRRSRLTDRQPTDKQETHGAHLPSLSLVRC